MMGRAKTMSQWRTVSPEQGAERLPDSIQFLPDSTDWH
ncbi:hypothetical protein B194_3522 [Serratia plymuthica A30]|nr:hypothetical protein B194_3522 [Serratia plymuthica A30]